MFSLVQISIALQQLHQFHCLCYNNPLEHLIVIVLALITGLLGMYVWASCPYRRVRLPEIAMNVQMVNGVPVVFVARTVYIVQY